MSEGGPDFAEPVIGYRIWEVRDGALLGPAYAQHWEPGENVSDCRGGTKHAAPAKDCRCGFNAYHERLPRPSLYGERYVAGAMAAWGEIEWHRTGFRAERACVVALCFDPKDGAARRAELVEVAKRYGVQLVPRQGLQAHAAHFGRSLGSPTPTRAAPKPVRQTNRALSLVPGGRGYWIGRHVVADWVPGGPVTIAMGRALARRVDRTARLVTLAPGSEVAAGDAVAVLHSATGSFAVASPAAGRVSVINYEALLDPLLATVDPSEGGWLVEVRPQDQLLDECPLVFGRRGREQDDAFSSRVGPERALDDVRLAGHVASIRMSCAEDAVALMRRRLARQAERAAGRLQAA